MTSRSDRLRRRPPALALGRGVALIAIVMVFSGCSSDDPLADRYGSGDAGNYESTDGAILEIHETNREAAATYSGTTETGIKISDADHDGRVVVVNFWYADCAPCRAEAPDLESLHQKHRNNDVDFVGVNTRDSSETALAFARNYGITYPSFMDGETGAVRLAFAGNVPPSATPTTLVLDKQGRVAARFLGQITSVSSLDTVVGDLVQEDP